MIGDKDSDMQAANKAGVGIRCQYLVDGLGGVMSSTATDRINTLGESGLLLNRTLGYKK